MPSLERTGTSARDTSGWARTAWLIARREYVERVRSRAFLLTTILTPLLMGGVLFGSIYAAGKAGGVNRLAVASPDAALARAVAQAVSAASNAPASVVVVAPANEHDRAGLTARVSAGENDRSGASDSLDGYLWLERKSPDALPTATYASRTSADIVTQGRLESAVSQGTTGERLMRNGMSGEQVGALLKHNDLRTLQVKNGVATDSDSGKSFASAYVMVMILYISVIFYGMNVARSVIQEKTSRIFEVLLATALPESLMLGKLLGVGAAGLTQIGIWFALLGAITGSALAAKGGITGFSSLGISPIQIVFFVVYFILGYLFYSGISAGIGATLSAEQEVQQFSFVIVAPLLVSVIMMSYVLGSPNAPLSVALSLFPPCTPIVMYLRLCSQQPPMWQLVLSVVLMVAAIALVVWIAARLYRVGILMYGKRATLPEMMRWLRYS